MARIFPAFTDDFHSSLGEYKIFNENNGVKLGTNNLYLSKFRL